MTAISRAINKLIKQRKNGFVYSTYHKVFVSQTQPGEKMFIYSFYSVEQGKVKLHEFCPVEKKWTIEKLN